jgi:hypothetical protein
LFCRHKSIHLQSWRLFRRVAALTLCEAIVLRLDSVVVGEGELGMQVLAFVVLVLDLGKCFLDALVDLEKCCLDFDAILCVQPVAYAFVGVQTLGAKCVGVEGVVTEGVVTPYGRLGNHLGMVEDETRGIDAVLMAVEQVWAFVHWLHTQNTIIEFEDLCDFQRNAPQWAVHIDRK